MIIINNLIDIYSALITKLKVLGLSYKVRLLYCTSFSEKTQKSNYLQLLEQRQHLLLNYYKTLGIEPEPPAQ